MTLIALFQGALAIYCFGFVCFAAINPAKNLGFLRSALRLLIGQIDRLSYLGKSRQEITMDLFFFSVAGIGVGAYSAANCWGLWRLKKAARHAVVAEYGAMLLMWARGFLFFGAGGGFSRVLPSKLQPVYMVILVEAMICLTLLYHGGVASAFGEVE